MIGSVPRYVQGDERVVLSPDRRRHIPDRLVTRSKVWYKLALIMKLATKFYGDIDAADHHASPAFAVMREGETEEGAVKEKEDGEGITKARNESEVGVFPSGARPVRGNRESVQAPTGTL